MDLEQLRTNIIQASLKPLSLWSPEAEALLCATAAQESLGGKFVMQVGGGPALGIYQMEPRTHDSIWRTKLSRPDRLPLIRGMLDLFSFSRMPKAIDMVWHNGYATFMARFYYLIIPEELPPAHDLKAQWEYYKKYWNTELGKATEEDFYRNVNNYFGLGKKKK
jgi:hypothetical protein